jgi:hypothetical protein
MQTPHLSGGAVITTALSSDVSNIMQFSKIEPFSILWLVSSALCDVAIAAALSFQLRKTSLVLVCRFLHRLCADSRSVIDMGYRRPAGETTTIIRST